jgi:hypothetical protein
VAQVLESSEQGGHTTGEGVAVEGQVLKAGEVDEGFWDGPREVVAAEVEVAEARVWSATMTMSSRRRSPHSAASPGGLRLQTGDQLASL